MKKTLERVKKINRLETIENGKIVPKFEEAYMIDDNDWEVLTPKGWIDIHGIGKTRPYQKWSITTVGEYGKLRNIVCADEHILARCDNINFDTKEYDLTEILTMELEQFDYLMTIDGPEIVIEIELLDEKDNMYDLQIDDGSDRHYYTNGFVTHNSLTLQNLAVNMANEGYNVGFVTLELSEKKTLKRIGSMALEIPIYEYNERAKDKDFMRRKMMERDDRLSGGLGRHKTGKLYIKEFPSGTATVSDIDAWCQQVEDETGNKLDALFVDYLQIMNTEGGVDRNMLYLKGEHLSVGLRAITQKRNLVGFSATQTDKNKYGANTYNLNDIPESKAIADTADTVWGIVLTPVMKAQKIYQWQPLKLRDSSTDIERVEFDFNPEYLRLVNDRGIIQSL